MTITLNGRRAIVTGAGRGLGKAYAEALAARGAKVVVNDIGKDDSEAPLAEQVANDIRQNGGEAIANTADLLDANQIDALVKEATDSFGGVDILINNAGFCKDRSFQKMRFDDYASVEKIHSNSVAYLTHCIWPIMCEQNYGRIVMVTSSSGLYGNYGQANYSAAKLAQVGLMNTLRHEGVNKDVRINALAPAALTSMTEQLMPKELGALISPEKVAAAIVYLSSENAPNGSVLYAAGGFFALARMMSTRGFVIRDEITPEAIAESWMQISDFSDPIGHESVNEEFEFVFSQLGVQ